MRPPFLFSLSMKYGNPILKISGDFRSGNQLSAMSVAIQSHARLCDGLTINLRGVKFMDSDSMALIKETEKFCKIEWSIKSWVFKRYVDYKIATESVFRDR